MKISDKIKELQNYLNQYGDLNIVTQSGDYELEGNYVSDESECKSKVKKMKKEKATFKDDFDGTIFQEEVYCYNNDGENVLIL